MSPHDRAQAVARLRYLLPFHWPSHARPDQLAPPGEWLVWLILAGRGWGKTRTGAEWIKDQALTHPGSRWAVVAATWGDARDTCVEGESGLLSILPDDRVRNWNRSLGELDLTNGSRIKLFTAEKPDRLRGPQHHGAWCDELAAWTRPEAWDQLQFGLRLGSYPRTVVTTTPRPTRLVKDLAKRTQTVVTRGVTFDNAANLAPAALAELEARYAGTRLGRQELYAELLDDTPGALWTLAQIDADRVTDFPDLRELVIAVDPAVTSTDESDETGIIAAGSDYDGHGYVLEDHSGKWTPEEVVTTAAQVYDDLGADSVVVEKNNGGDWLPSLFRQLAPHVRVETVWASRGKHTRAEPVAGLYEQHRIHHVGSFPRLEDQLCTWTPDITKNKNTDPNVPNSPDRMDALVWGMHRLFLNRPGRAGRITHFTEAAA